MIEYRIIKFDELNRKLFGSFIRHQVVTKCYRKEDGKWTIKDAPFIDDWNEEEYDFLVTCLKNTIKTGGLVYGAFLDGVLKGFVSVETGIFGGENKYLDLSSIHISEDMRGNGVGSILFRAAKEWAKKMGAKNCIYRLIQLWKRRHFTKKWVVWKQWNIMRSM